MITTESIIFFIILIISIIVHELAHGYTALFLGDHTAENKGRLTLNPIAHADLFGTIILPLIFLLSGSSFFFGFAKPVPYNPENLKNKKWGETIVAIAGPISNIILALFFLLLLFLFTHTGFGNELVLKVLNLSILINILLAVFNLLPIPPLDGSKVLFDLIKNYKVKYYKPVLNFFHKYQLLIFIAFLFVLISTNFLGKIVYPIYQFLINLI
ncbi:site-2 protease family protein [Candidatus Campbellbacteria bacterium]|nr:MAG: site-2 protease family protein [Candidatus Campbellbacteria bacterium]